MISNENMLPQFTGTLQIKGEEIGIGGWVTSKEGKIIN